MTTRSITSGQRDQIGNFAAAAAKKAVDELALDGQAVQRVIERGDRFKAGIQRLLARLSATPLAHDRAKAIMGKNFFGVEDAVKHFAVKPTDDQLAALATIPFSEETLKECKNTHVLVAVFPISILAIRGIAPRKVFYGQDWYDREQFATQASTVGWKLVRKTPVEDSTSKTWEDQQRLLHKNEETPSAQVVIYTMVGHFLATGERLFGNIYVRCSDLDSLGYRVGVGGFEEDGLVVGNYWDGDRDGYIGLSSARRPD